jgi:hypothetical protein
MAALRSDRRMRLTLRFPYMIEESSMKISFLNVRSLPKHTEDIKLDRSLMTCDLCIFCETRLMLHDVSDTNHPYNLPGYGLSVFEGIVSNNQRSHYGLVVYSRCPLSYCSQVTRMTIGPQPCAVESVVVQYTLSSNIVLNIVGLYRRPSSDLQQLIDATARLKHFLCNISLNS